MELAGEAWEALDDVLSIRKDARGGSRSGAAILVAGKEDEREKGDGKNEGKSVQVSGRVS